MIYFDPMYNDVRYQQLYSDTAARNASNCRTSGTVFVLPRAATRTSKPTNKKLRLTPFSSRLTPFQLLLFRSLSFWQGVCQRVVAAITPIFCSFLDSQAKVAAAALTIPCGFCKVIYLLG
jgi:hypothetical protein